MERLVREAAALTEVQEELGVTVDANSLSFANIVDAISVVQRKMGIMGTTAEEAAHTVSGSVGAMRAAWQNLITGVANDQANFGQLVDDLVESVGAAAENVLPRVEIALGGVGRLVEGLAPVIAEHLPGLADKVLPGLVGAATGLVNSLAGQLPTLAGTGVTLFGTLLDNAPSIVTNLTGKLPEIITGLTNALTDPDKDLIGKMVGAGVKLFEGLAKDAPAIIEALADATPKIVSGLADAILDPENIQRMMDAGVDLFVSLGKNVPGILEGLAKSAGSIVEGAARLVAGEDVGEIVGGLLDGGVEWAIGTLTGDKEKIGNAITDSLKGAIDLARPSTKESAESYAIESAAHLTNKLTEVLYPDLYSIGETSSTKLGDGFAALNESTKKRFADKVDDIVSAVNAELGINSPSTVFKRVGGFMAEGVGVGFEEKVPGIRKSIIRRMREIVGAVRNEMQIASPSKIFAQIGKFMAQGVGVGWDSEIGNVNELITQSISPDFEPVSTTRRGGNTYNIYAQKMTPAEMFEESRRVADDAEFLGFAPVTA